MEINKTKLSSLNKKAEALIIWINKEEIHEII